jgi:hypothetical protein
MLNHGVASAMAGGWQLTGLLIMFTGAHFSVSADGTSLNASGNTQRANQVKPSVVHSGRQHGPWTVDGTIKNLTGFTSITGTNGGPGREGIDERMRQFGLRVRF